MVGNGPADEREQWHHLGQLRRRGRDIRAAVLRRGAEGQEGYTAGGSLVLAFCPALRKVKGGGGKSTADGIRWRKEWGDVGNDERAREPAVEESTRRGWTAALTGLAEQKFPVIGDYFVREIPPSDNVSPPLGADRKWG